MNRPRPIAGPPAVLRRSGSRGAWPAHGYRSPRECRPSFRSRSAIGWTPSAGARSARLARTGLASPATTSVGRLFDAVAALCGLRTEINYEGQAAIELEAACDPHEQGSYPMPVSRSGDAFAIDPRQTIAAVSADVTAGVAAAVIASRFHRGLARSTVEASVQAASVHHTEVVVLSGGVFLNRRLLETVSTGLSARGLRVLTPQLLPAGDGGISYGQAAVAASRGAA